MRSVDVEKTGEVRLEDVLEAGSDVVGGGSIVVGDCSATEVGKSDIVPCSEVSSASEVCDAMADGVSSIVVEVTGVSSKVEELGVATALVAEDVVLGIAGK